MFVRGNKSVFFWGGLKNIQTVEDEGEEGLLKQLGVVSVKDRALGPIYSK